MMMLGYPLHLLAKFLKPARIDVTQIRRQDALSDTAGRHLIELLTQVAFSLLFVKFVGVVHGSTDTV
jgi:hypothetical protein